MEQPREAKRPSPFVSIAAGLIIAAGFAYMLYSDTHAKRPVAASPAPVEPVEVSGAPGSYYFPGTGDSWIVARHTFEAAHPELACEYSGVQEKQALGYMFVAGHYLVCRNIAIDAESVTIP